MKTYPWLRALAPAVALLFASGANAADPAPAPLPKAPLSAKSAEDRVNVRAQPTTFSEVLTQLRLDDTVVVLDQIPANKPKAGEPANWFKIRLPAKTPVWVFAPFVTNKTVSANRINLRAGPGENYSVIGRLEKGSEVKEIRTVESWTELETPEQAYGFVDRSLLIPVEGSAEPKPAEAKPAEIAAATTPTAPEPAAPPQIVAAKLVPVAPAVGLGAAEAKAASEAEAAKLAAKAAEERAAAQKLVATTVKPEEPAPVAAITPEVRKQIEKPFASSPITAPSAAAPEKKPEIKSAATVAVLPPTVPAVEKKPEPKPVAAPAAPAVAAALPQIAPVPEAKTPEPVKRVVRREGIVRGTVSIQAPTYFELVSPETKKVLNYLHTEQSGLKLKSFKGQRVVVTGEEGIDSRWPNTPLMEIETLETAP